jgi:hypothetical protein
MSIYTEQGFQSRKDYLVNLANDFGLPVNTVFMAASTLGPSEDFDGLISTLEDIDPDNLEF